MDAGVTRGHMWAGVTEQLLRDVLRDAAVDEPGPQGVAELVAGHSNWLSSLVAQADDPLPALKLLAQSAVRIGLVASAGSPPGLRWRAA